jgi:type II secretory pathway pseudopilin PulG
MFKQKGFTLIELIICIAVPITLCVGGGVIYVAWHFISKAW